MVWQSSGSTGTDTSLASIQGQRYAANGSAIGAEFQVNTYTTGKQDYPAVASNSTGTNFVVAWRSDGSPGDDASGTSIQGQRYLPEPSFVPSVGAMLAMLVALARRQRLS